MEDNYYIISKESVEEIKVKGSRFIGRSFIVSNPDEAMEQLNKIKKIEYAATHNCYAYHIGIDPQKIHFKYSDDGEPSGTAGKPIYDILHGSGLTNILVVVTRYFGGTKLGTGGLVKAYGETAKLVIEKSGRKELFITDILNFEIEFPLYDQFLKIANRIGATVLDSVFTDHVTLKIEIRQSQTANFKQDLIELTSGKINIESEN